MLANDEDDDGHADNEDDEDDDGHADNEDDDGHADNEDDDGHGDNEDDDIVFGIILFYCCHCCRWSDESKILEGEINMHETVACELSI